jgi:steroid 5-alpha reductase family enzyme
MNAGELFALNATALFMAFSMLWVISLLKKDVSIVDLFWGPAFALVAALGFVFGAAQGSRPGLVAALVTLWGLRLSLHLFLRNRGKPEDFRYAEMRRKAGARFPQISFFSVFSLQAALVLVISTPIVLVTSSASRDPLGWLDALATVLMLMGISLESVADLQLRSFLRSSGNRGKVLDKGLWRYSRHPNYFGDAVVWWGLGTFGLASGSWGGLLGPAVMTFLLLRVSGVSLLEKSIGRRRPEYAQYVATTSAFFPLPKRRTRVQGVAS